MEVNNKSRVWIAAAINVVVLATLLGISLGISSTPSNDLKPHICIERDDIEEWSQDYEKDDNTYLIKKVGHKKILAIKSCGFNCTSEEELSIAMVKATFHIVKCNNLLEGLI